MTLAEITQLATTGIVAVGIPAIYWYDDAERQFVAAARRYLNGGSPAVN